MTTFQLLDDIQAADSLQLTAQAVEALMQEFREKVLAGEEHPRGVPVSVARRMLGLSDEATVRKLVRKGRFKALPRGDWPSLKSFMVETVSLVAYMETRRVYVKKSEYWERITTSPFVARGT